MKREILGQALWFLPDYATIWVIKGYKVLFSFLKSLNGAIRLEFRINTIS